MNNKPFCWINVEGIAVPLDDRTGKLDVMTVLGEGVVDIEATIGFVTDVANVDAMDGVIAGIGVGLMVVVEGNKVAPKGALNGSTANEIGRAADLSPASRLLTHIVYRLFEITIPPLPKLLVDV